MPEFLSLLRVSGDDASPDIKAHIRKTLEERRGSPSRRKVDKDPAGVDMEKTHEEHGDKESPIVVIASIILSLIIIWIPRTSLTVNANATACQFVAMNQVLVVNVKTDPSTVSGSLLSTLR
jgi:hypothetical protein